MLCISMKTDEFVKVGKQLLYNYASAYDWNIPPSFRSKFSDFVKVSKSEHIKEPPWNNTVLLTTLAGQSFTSFAKFANFHEDLYWYLVAPSLEDDLYVETWMRNHKLRSFCNGSYHVENVLFMRFPNVPGQGTRKLWTTPSGQLARTRSGCALEISTERKVNISAVAEQYVVCSLLLGSSIHRQYER
ncbi:deoxyribonuclease-2-alpha isoform X3 [Strongylocentrotus purpuratus]|uniref:Uncharacterized protein n=1 Tax=Strongylocentrotus purpuratus TaxID=7668 RepID=A0A7M7GFE8_STRPU|nr:deoxyribonuclease-2-alpha isoform X3 [Strongylocentrotus purpuratus]